MLQSKNELRLSMDNGNYQGISLEVHIVALRVGGLDNSGAGNMFVYNVDEPGVFKVTNSGSADILIEGASASSDINIEGSGRIRGFNFAVNESRIDIDGSGDVEVNCSESLVVKIDGSGSVYYIGNPIIDADISGSGQVVNEG